MLHEACQAAPLIGEARPSNSVAFVLKLFKKTQPLAKIVDRESVSETSAMEHEPFHYASLGPSAVCLSAKRRGGSVHKAPFRTDPPALCGGGGANKRLSRVMIRANSSVERILACLPAGRLDYLSRSAYFVFRTASFVSSTLIRYEYVIHYTAAESPVHDEMVC